MDHYKNWVQEIINPTTASSWSPLHAQKFCLAIYQTQHTSSDRDALMQTDSF